MSNKVLTAYFFRKGGSMVNPAGGNTGIAAKMTVDVLPETICSPTF